MEKEKNEEFNLFRNLKMHESQHSNLLRKLLHLNGKHHQGDLFLAEFLKTLKTDPSILINSKVEITNEKKAGSGRVDIFISIGDHKILIENKVNGAINQKNQLYKYWKNLIFEPEFKKYCKEHGKEFSYDIPIDESYFRSEVLNKYKLIYLVRSTKGINDWDAIEGYKQSIQKPQNPTYSKFNNLPKEVPVEIIKLGFKEDIVTWLKTCLSKVTKNEKCSKKNINRFKHVIKQYIEEIEG
jgi:hypothetical protein